MQTYQKHFNTILITAMVVGGFFGALLPESAITIAIVGELFLRLLTLLIVPVIFFSMLSGVLNLKTTTTLASVGGKTLLYYMTTTAIAVVIGLGLVNVVQPGLHNGDTSLLTSLQSEQENQSLDAPSSDGSKTHSFHDVFRNIIPKNIIQAAHDGNVLGIIFFSLFLGVALLHLPNEATKNTLRETSQGLFEAIIWMIEKTMLLAPIGFFSLIASLIGEFILSNQLSLLGESILHYTFTVVAGLLIHGCLILPFIARIFGVHPLRLFRAMTPAVLSAASTASSSATLPITLDCLERKAGVPTRIGSFVAPLGSTINMDGTAIYEAVAVVFIANMLGTELTFSHQILIFLTATLSAIGAAGIPGAGLIMMVLILNIVGLPEEGIMLVIIVDRLLDMLRTAVNVWGDSIGAAIIATTEK